jgi:hypothetical protein
MRTRKFCFGKEFCIYFFNARLIRSARYSRFFCSLLFLFVTTYKRFLVGVLIAIWVVVRISYFIIVSGICWVRRLLVVGDDTRLGKM